MELRDHETELVHDFRSIYGLSAFEVGITFSGREAIALLDGLLLESSSFYYAKKAGWKFPASREYLALADLIDITILSNADPKSHHRIPPYSRPATAADDVVKGTKMSIERAREVYSYRISTKTEEEIKENNRQFIAAQKQKEEADGPQ